MKAGRTQLRVGTLVRVTGIANNDPEDTDIIGIEGEITHPFPGLMHGPSSQYVAGLYLTDAMVKRFGLARSPLGGGIVNLMRNDTFEIVPVHLRNLRNTGSVCGAEASEEAGNLTTEITEVSCVACYTRHEAYCESRDEDSPHHGRSEADLLADPAFRAECEARIKQA